MRRWFSFSKTFGRKISKARPTSRKLGIESLQDRRMLAVLTVNSLADNTTSDTVLTLREAIAAVNGGSTSGLSVGEANLVDTSVDALGVNDTIRVDASLENVDIGFGLGTIGVSIVGDTTNGPSAFLLSADVTIQGFEGSDNLWIARDPNVVDLRLFSIGAGVTVILSNMTMAEFTSIGTDGGVGAGGGGGGSAGTGGAILVNAGADLTVIDSTFCGNGAVGGNGGGSTGGGSFFGGNGGTPDVGGGVGGSEGIPGTDGGLFAGGGGGQNWTGGFVGARGGFGAGGGGGGGASSGSGSDGGEGGVSGGPLYGGIGGAGQSNGNVGGGGGGGSGMGGAIFNHQGDVTLIRSTLCDNFALGGDGGDGFFDGGAGSGLGGAIFNYNGDLTIENCTIGKNAAIEGNGLFSGFQLGGGVFTHNGVTNLLNTTTAYNDAGDGEQFFALAVAGTAVVELNNTILSNASSGTDFDSAIFLVGSRGFTGAGNLIVNNAGGVRGFSGNIISTTDPNLGLFDDHGGATDTFSIETSSSAFNNGFNALAASLTTDQRGEGFGRVNDGTVDIGAFEAQTDSVITMITRSNPTTEVTDANSVTVLVTFSRAVTGLTASNVVLSGTAASSGTIGTPLASNAGLTWTVQVTGLASAEGTLQLDLANNTGVTEVVYSLPLVTTTFTSGQTYTLDHTAPDPPEFADVIDDTGASDHDQITYDQTLQIMGTAEAASTVSVTRVGTGVIGTVIADINGNWTFDYTATTLPVGTSTFTATAEDEAGNISTASANFVVTVNATPGTPSVTDATTSVGQQTTSGLVVTRAIADDSNVAYFKITDIEAGTLYLNDGVTLVGDGDFITFAQANAGLKFTPTGAGDGGFQVQSSTTDDDSGLGGGLATATIEVEGELPTTIGLYDPTAGEYFLRNTNTSGIADTSFYYGPAPSTEIAISGDWDGDGVATIGLYDPINGSFFLRNSNDTGIADLSFYYGAADAGWLPIVGDWDGDGTDTIGLYAPSSSTFFLRNTNDAGIADEAFEYGPAGSEWLPITGDWDGDGTFTIGLYDSTTSVFYLRNSNDGGFADDEFWFGLPDAGWRPITGDWDGDESYSVGLYGAELGEFHLRNSNTQGVADVVFRYGPTDSGLTPITGRWTDVFVNSVALASPDAPSASGLSDDLKTIVLTLADTSRQAVSEYTSDVRDRINATVGGGHRPTMGEVRALADDIESLADGLRNELQSEQSAAVDEIFTAIWGSLPENVLDHLPDDLIDHWLGLSG